MQESFPYNNYYRPSHARKTIISANPFIHPSSTVMCRDQFDPITMFSPTGSPRSSVSSTATNVCGAPLTPLYELDGAAGEMVVTESSTVDDSEGEQDALRAHIAAEQASKRVNLSLAVPPPPAFSTFTFPPQGTGSSVVSPSDEGIALPREGFTFGTCPSTPFLGTPVAEQGPFEYPDMTSGSRSTSRSSSIKGSSQSRSNSRSPVFHARRPLSLSSQQSLHSQSDIPSPPATRRSSTVSDIATLPVTGRRPSIVHSVTAETSVADPTSAASSNNHSSTLSVTPLPTPLPIPTPAPPLSHHGSIRRPSTLSFQQKALPAPIPPSLLARRGSLPAAQLFGLPLSELSAHRSRASASGIPAIPQSPAITTASLYQRRQSITTETETETGATGATGAIGGGVGHPTRGTLPEKMRTTSVSAGSDSTGYASSDRRGSFPSIHPVHSLSSSRHTLLNRSGSTSSHTSRASRRSFTSSRTPTPPAYCSSSSAMSSPRTQPASLLPPLSVPPSPQFTRSSSADGVPTQKQMQMQMQIQTQTGSGCSRHSQSRSSSDEDDESLPTPAMDSLSISRGGGDGGGVVSGEGLNPDVVSGGSSEDEVYLGMSGSQMVVVESPKAMRDEKVSKESLPSSWPVHVIAPTPPIETQAPGLETVFERPPLESAESVDSGKTLTV